MYHVLSVDVVRRADDVEGVGDGPKVQSPARLEAVWPLTVASLVQIAVDQRAKIFQQLLVEEALCGEVAHVLDKVFGVRLPALHALQHCACNVVQSLEESRRLRSKILEGAKNRRNVLHCHRHVTVSQSDLRAAMLINLLQIGLLSSHMKM